MIRFNPIRSSSKGCAYLVESGGTRILIECGLPVSELRAAVGNLAELDACLISHSHKDHSRSREALERLGVLIAAPFLPSRSPLSDFPIVGIDPVGVRAFPVAHDVVAYGFLVFEIAGDRLLYLTDTPYCRHRFSGLTHIAVETNYSIEILRSNVEKGLVPQMVAERVQRNHMSLERCLELLKANDLSALREVHLLHMSEKNSDEALFKRRVQEVTGCPVHVARA